MTKRKKWEMLTDSERIEELHRQTTDLAGAIQTIRLDLAHIIAKSPAMMAREKK